jgi:hypothetical protein
MAPLSNRADRERRAGEPKAGRALVADLPFIQFQPELAARVGTHEATFLALLHYWLQGTRHHEGGRPWVYNSLPRWHAQLPHIARPTLRRAIERLREDGIVVTANFNAKPWDRTLWYTIDHERLRRVTHLAIAGTGDGGAAQASPTPDADEVGIEATTPVIAGPDRGARVHALAASTAQDRPEHTHAIVMSRPIPREKQEIDAPEVREISRGVRAHKGREREG